MMGGAVVLIGSRAFLRSVGEYRFSEAISLAATVGGAPLDEGGQVAYLGHGPARSRRSSPAGARCVDFRRRRGIVRAVRGRADSPRYFFAPITATRTESVCPGPASGEPPRTTTMSPDETSARAWASAIASRMTSSVEAEAWGSNNACTPQHRDNWRKARGSAVNPYNGVSGRRLAILRAVEPVRVQHRIAAA